MIQEKPRNTRKVSDLVLDHESISAVYNVRLEDGLGPLFCLWMTTATKVTVCRAIEDGDYSAIPCRLYILGDCNWMVGFEFIVGR